MKLNTIALSALFSTALLLQPAAQAADTTIAIEQMAEIMVSLENTPSEDDKITLDDIANDYSSTDAERALAQAIMHMDTKLRPEDKPNVTKVMVSPAASENERAMAKTLLRFDGKPSAQTRAMLSQWIEN